MTDRMASEEIVRLAVEACPSGMTMTAADGKIVLVNVEAERLFGYARARSARLGPIVI
ncbi:MAG: PAS domain-containing protein [Xanthobacteraceae bacterium]|jgi:PAS domain S-box-containing protein